MTRAISIEVLSPDNKKVLKRYRVKAPKGKMFTSEGIDTVLDDFVEQFDLANPNHKYRLVPLKGARFRLVHEPLPASTPKGLPRTVEDLMGTHDQSGN